VGSSKNPCGLERRATILSKSWFLFGQSAPVRLRLVAYEPRAHFRFPGETGRIHQSSPMTLRPPRPMASTVDLDGPESADQSLPFEQAPSTASQDGRSTSSSGKSAFFRLGASRTRASAPPSQLAPRQRPRNLLMNRLMLSTRDTEDTPRRHVTAAEGRPTPAHLIFSKPPGCQVLSKNAFLGL
jgi:hypothetical protein